MGTASPARLTAEFGKKTYEGCLKQRDLLGGEANPFQQPNEVTQTMKEQGCPSCPVVSNLRSELRTFCSRHCGSCRFPRKQRWCCPEIQDKLCGWYHLAQGFTSWSQKQTAEKKGRPDTHTTLSLCFSLKPLSQQPQFDSQTVNAGATILLRMRDQPV